MDSQNFRSLKVWQLGMQLAEEVYRLSQQFPKQEMYGLTSQIQRAAVSIPANIAEGHAMGSSKDFLRFLAIAQGSLAELETHLMLAVSHQLRRFRPERTDSRSMRRRSQNVAEPAEKRAKQAEAKQASDWGQSGDPLFPIPNPQSLIPNPQSPIPQSLIPNP